MIEQPDVENSHIVSLFRGISHEVYLRFREFSAEFAIFCKLCYNTEQYKNTPQRTANIS